MVVAMSLSTAKMSVSLRSKSRPRDVIIRGSDQLHIDAHLIICFLDATFQEIGDAELVRNLGGTLRCVLVTLRGRARDHFEIRDL